MQTILVPTDFSPTAMKAAVYAATIAQKSGALVLLLHVIEPVTNGISQPYALQEKIQEEIDNNRRKELEALQQSIHQLFSGIKTAAELNRGTVTTAILLLVESRQVDLIVMGTKGATGLKEIFMGTVTAGTIARSTIPVLSVPEAYEMQPPDTILFATNHFERNKALLNQLVEVATLFAATIHVAVFVDMDAIPTTDYLINARELNYYLEFLRHNYRAIDFKGEVLEGKEFEAAIEKYDAQNEVDIIAMITYPKSFWERLVRKSATKRMAFHSKIPVLAIPAG